jgi:hypothetical protein
MPVAVLLPLDTWQNFYVIVGTAAATLTLDVRSHSAVATAEQSAEGKGDRALPVRVDVLPIDLHLGAVMDHALDHRGHLR